MLLRVVTRSLRQHALSTIVTALSLGLGAGLVMAVFQVAQQTERAFVGPPLGFDAVVGPPGSPIQVVLNAVFHLDTSPGNLSWSTYQEIADHPRVERAVPYVVGDSFRGFRVIGTTPELYRGLEYFRGEPLQLEGEGAWFDPWRMEAVFGAQAARETGLGRGAHFHPTHGIEVREEVEEDHAHEEEYTVVGVLEPTNSPLDRLVFIPIEGALRMQGHILRGEGEHFEPEPGVPVPDEHKEISAALVQVKGGVASGMQLVEEFDRLRKEATVAYPVASSMARLFERLSWVTEILRLLAYLVVVVATAGVLASIYNTMHERRRDFAILRALGARRSTVFLVIVLESGGIAALGSLLAYAVYAVILGGAAHVIRSETGVVLELTSLHPALWWTPIGTIALGALAGVVPAFKAYSTDVARGLQPSS